MRSLKQSLIIGLSALVLGLSSPYCGGSSGGDSGGSGGTPVPVNHAPVLVQNFDNIVTEKDVPNTIPNISSHFYDEEGDNLTYNVKNFNNINAVLNGNTIDISSQLGYYGTEIGYVEACDPSHCVSDSLEIKVNNPPIADAGNDISGNIGFSVYFDGSKSYDVDGMGGILGGILSCSWDWGDGTSYTETPTSAILDPDGFNCKTTHIYTNPIGNHCRNPPTCSLWDYEVIFTIEDNNNSTSIDKCYVDF